MESLNLISTVICDLDPMGLLAGGAPEDEYEPEIREIDVHLPLARLRLGGDVIRRRFRQAEPARSV